MAESIITTTTEQAITAADTMAEELVEAFLGELDRMPATVASYRSNLKPLLSWLKGEGVAINEVTTAHALAYKKHLTATRSAATVNAYVTTARRLYAWVELKTGYKNPFQGVEGIRGVNKGTSKAHDAMTRTQAKKVAAHEGEGQTGLRDRAMCNLALVAALRTVELARLSVGDYRRIGSVPTIAIQGKGHQTADTIKALDDNTAELLDAYLATRSDLDDEDAPLFASTSNRNRGGRMTTRAIGGVLKGTMRAEGIDTKRLTPHSYRHTSISILIEQGADLREAQKHARHADPRTTEIYIHAAEALNAKTERMVAAAIA